MRAGMQLLRMRGVVHDGCKFGLHDPLHHKILLLESSIQMDDSKRGEPDKTPLSMRTTETIQENKSKKTEKKNQDMGI